MEKFKVRTRLEKIEVYYLDYEIEAESQRDAELEVLDGGYTPVHEEYMGAYEREDIRK